MDEPPLPSPLPPPSPPSACTLRSMTEEERGESMSTAVR